MKRKICSLLLVLCMVLGITTLTASAAEVTVPEGWYQVSVKVAPSAATVKFYSDSDATQEITENVYDDGIVDGYHQYTFVAQEGVYSYRAWEGEQSLGGMEFKVPIADEYASDGTLMGKGQVLTLKRVNFTANGVLTAPEDFTLSLIPQDLKEAVPGPNYVNEDGNVVAPIMVNAGGNALTYNAVINVNNIKFSGGKYSVSPISNITFTPGTTTETRMFSVNGAKIHTITAPAGARVQMFMQVNNYNVREIPAHETETLADGRVKTSFNISGGDPFTYRVSMAGKVTRAGYIGSYEENRNIVVEFAANENPKSTKTTASRIENSSMVNINSQNNLKMAVGETFRLRSFRAGWQIINTDPGNIMIEPDFHYNIISGGEHIELIPVTDKCTGNAGSGMNGNWMDIKALSTGTVILEVSYDAIQIGGTTAYPGTFGAVDPSRKSVVIINIGASKADSNLKITPVHGSHSVYTWDADMDTVYFLEDSTDFNFTANMGGTVELSTDLGKTWMAVAKSGDTYTAEDLVAGNNILRFTNGSDVQYQVVRAAKLKMNVENTTRLGDPIIVGDKIKVTFECLYTPVPKMSGIYNPGWTSCHRTIFQVPEGVTASSTSSQYGFAADNKYDLVFSEAGTYIFTGGYISSAVMGDPIGSHRALTDSGRGVNMNASNASSNRSILPDLTFEVIDMPETKVTVASNPEGAVVEVYDASGAVLTPGEDGTYVLANGTYSYKLTMEGYVPNSGKFTVGGEDNQTGTKTVTIDMLAVGGDVWDGKSAKKPTQNSDGVYEIGTGPELYYYSKYYDTKYMGSSAIMTADMSLGGFGLQLNKLSGTFDGNGHYITDFYGEALFKYPQAGAVIKNLGVVGETTGAGIVMEDVIANAYTIENCVSHVNVKGSSGGGIVGGGSSNATIRNCYNTGYISSGSGIASGASAIENCYNIGKASSYGISGSGSRRNNYTLQHAAPSAGGSVVTADNLKNYASTLGEAYLDNHTSYNNGYPILKWEEPRALAVAHEEFSAELEAYNDGEGFNEYAAALLEKAVEDGKQSISVATTLADAQEALDQAKAVIDAIDPESVESPALVGDANGDGKVSIKDVINLRKYLIDNTHEININCVDLNEDGKITIKDVIFLRKALLSN